MTPCAPSLNRRTFLTGLAATVAVRAASAAPPARLGIGQIGTVHAHAAGKLQTVRDLPEIWTVAGWVEADARRAEAMSRVKAYAGLRRLEESELLANRDVKVVIVETAVEDACATALRALRAGKHVHLDKPGALNHAEFKSMRLEAEQRGLTVQMGYMLRYNPGFEFLFDVVRQGWIGEILEIEASMSKKSGDAERAAIGALPGGAMFELGCHPIDVILTLLGKPARVLASSTPTQRDGVKDNQLAVLEYPRASATVRINVSDPFGGERRRFMVGGTEGTLELLPMESGRGTLWLTRERGRFKRGKQALALPATGGRYKGEFIDLAPVVRGEKPLAWNASHDVAVHETVLRAAGAWA
jgi:predicted dehydrogenase